MDKEYNKEDSDKLERMYKKYKLIMLAEAYNILYDRSEAEDAVQQSFLKLTTCVDKIKDDDPGMTCNFLKVVVRNVAKDLYKKRLYLNTEDDEVEKVADKKRHRNTETSHVVIAKDSVNTIINAILGLPEKYRDVIMLEKIYGYSREESMKILNINYETIKKRMTRAKAKLTEALEKEGIDVGRDEYRKIVRWIDRES